MTDAIQERDTAGRFASADHTAPELSLTAKNTDGHYGWETPLLDADEIDPGERQAWIEANIDEYFAAGEPQPLAPEDGADPFGPGEATVTPF